MKEAISKEWSLEEFYKGYEDPAYKKDLETMDSLVEQLENSLKQAQHMEEKMHCCVF